MGMIGNSLAQGLVSGANIVDGTVDTADIKDAAVTPAKLSTGHPTWDSSGNFLINASGTPAAGAKMKIATSTRTGAFLDLTATGGENWVIDSTNTTGSTDVLGIYANGATGMYLTDTGNVGIGTSSPSKKLELGALGALRLQTGSVTMDCTPTPGGIDGFVWNVSSGYHQWSIGGSSRMQLGSTGRLLLTPSGGFASAPTSTDMTAAAGFSMSLGGGDYFSIGQMSGSHIWMQAAYGAQPNLAYYNLHLQPNGGNVIIGRGSNYSNSYKLQVGNGSSAAAMYLDSNGSGAWVYGVDTANYPSGGWIIGHITTTANKLQARCGSSGGLEMTSGGTSWSAISDERLKDIIEPIENAASKVSSLRAVIGKYKTDEEGTRRSFLIAQDVQAALPEAVSTTRASKEDEQDYLTVAYTDLIPLLVAACKEQQTIIEQLKSRIEILEAN